MITQPNDMDSNILISNRSPTNNNEIGTNIQFCIGNSCSPWKMYQCDDKGKWIRR